MLQNRHSRAGGSSVNEIPYPYCGVGSVTVSEQAVEADPVRCVPEGAGRVSKETGGPLIAGPKLGMWKSW